MFVIVVDLFSFVLSIYLRHNLYCYLFVIAVLLCMFLRVLLCIGNILLLFLFLCLMFFICKHCSGKEMYWVFDGKRYTFKDYETFLNLGFTDANTK